MSKLQFLIYFICLLTFSDKGLAAIVEKDIVYDVVQGKNLVLDVYKSENPNPGPAIIYTHGGCWSGGSKNDIPSYVVDLTKKGFTIFAVGYRLSTVAPYPAALKDVQQAVRFVRKNAARFNIDPTKLASHGESAGGYLAAALGVRDITDRDGKVDEYSDRVIYVSDWYGRTDFTRTQPNPNLDCALSFLNKKRTPDTMKDFEEASILPFVDEKSAQFSIVHGTKDINVDPVHSRLLIQKLESYNKKPDSLFVDAAHGFFGGKPWDFSREKLLKFFERELLLTKASRSTSGAARNIATPSK